MDPDARLLLDTGESQSRGTSLLSGEEGSTNASSDCDPADSSRRQTPSKSGMIESLSGTVEAGPSG